MHHEPSRPASALRPAALAALTTLALLAPAAGAQAGGYDLAVTVAPANALTFDDRDLGWSQTLDWTVEVVNAGPDPSPATTLTVRPPGVSSGADCSSAAVTRTSIQCGVPALAGGESFNALVTGVVGHSDLPADVLAPGTASVPCGSPQESDCANNSSTASATVAFAPHVSMRSLPGLRRARRRLLLSGSASPATAAPASAVAGVQVAVLRIGGPGCRWLDGRGAFTPRPADHGRCDQPTWLAAQGTAGWSRAIPRGLPRGRYAAYARATSASGASDLSFSANRRNAITILVR